jgi:hypothetical protein
MNVENKTQTNKERSRAFWSAAIPRVRDRFQKRGHVRALQSLELPLQRFKASTLHHLNF